MRNTVITQQSPNDIGGVLGDRLPILSGSDLGGGIHILFSTAPFTSNPTIQNVTFQNIQPAAITIDRDTRLGNNATVSGLKIENSPALYWYRDLVQPNTATNSLIDLDGSLIGLPSTISGPSVALSSEYFDPEFNAFVVPV